MNRQGIVRQGGGIVRSETVIAIDRPDTAGCLDHGWQAPSLGIADISQSANQHDPVASGPVPDAKGLAGNCCKSPHPSSVARTMRLG